MTNPIHDRIGGKYYRRGSTRYWFYGFTTVILLILVYLMLTNLDINDRGLFLATGSMCASGIVIGVIALFSAPFAVQVVSQMRKHEAYELIKITTLTRQQLLFGLMSGMVARFRGAVGLPLLMITPISVLGVIGIFLLDNLIGILLIPLFGIFGLCYLGLLAGIASSLMIKSTIGANILALTSHFIVVSVWFLFGYLVVLITVIFYTDDIYGFYDLDKQALFFMAARTAIAPYLIALIPLTLSFIFIRRT